MSNTNVIVAGPRGKMGSEALRMIEKEEQFSLVACIDRKNAGLKVQDVEGLPAFDAPIYDDVEQCFQDVQADVLIDLTTPEYGYKHTRLALEYGIRPVVGTTGFTKDQLAELEARGADLDGMKIHSVRLPGLIAHQEVVFGSNGQTLTLKHDSYHRESFMSGVKLAVEHVLKLDVLVYGLENLLE